MNIKNTIHVSNIFFFIIYSSNIQLPLPARIKFNSNWTKARIVERALSPLSRMLLNKHHYIIISVAAINV